MTVADAYERIAPYYDTAPNALLALEQRTLAPLLPDLAGRTVVDVGAGTGRWLRRLGSSNRIAPLKTVAIDVSAAMLATAPGPRIVADAGALPLQDAAADAVLCTFTLGYAPACFGELVRITRPGGTLIVTDVHPDAIIRGWKRIFRAGAELVEPPHHSYAIDALARPGLVRTHLIEPRLGEPERSLFVSRPELFDSACEHPAIFVAIWTKQ